MKRKYILNTGAEADIIKANKMETYLRTFKILARSKFDQDLNNKADF
jgi:hypothetical protein